MKWLILLCSFLSFTAFSQQSEMSSGMMQKVAKPWPQWLGEELQPDSSSHWQTEITDLGVTYSPAQSLPTVLVIISRKAKSYDTALNTLLGAFSRKLPQAQLVIRKLPTEEVELAELLNHAEQSSDLIYTVGSKATVAVRAAFKGRKTPVVSVNAKDPVQLGLIDDYQGSGDNFAFTSLNLPADVTLAFMQRFKPQLEQVAVLYAKRNKSAYVTQYLPLKKEAEQKEVKVWPIMVDESDPDLRLETTMKRTISELKQNDPNLTKTVLWLTGSSSLLARVAEINQYSSNLPLISAVPDVVRQGKDSALMSFGVSFVNNAHQAALYGLSILKGETTAGELPVGLISPPDIAISFEQAQRINQQIPFVLMEMASDVYDTDGKVIRSEGKSMQEQQ